MSKQYDAKMEALEVYPSDRDQGVALFQFILNVSEEDFRYEEGMSFEEYLYGPGQPVTTINTAEDEAYPMGQME